LTTLLAEKKFTRHYKLHVNKYDRMWERKTNVITKNKYTYT